MFGSTLHRRLLINTKGIWCNLNCSYKSVYGDGRLLFTLSIINPETLLLSIFFKKSDSFSRRL